MNKQSMMIFLAGFVLSSLVVYLYFNDLSYFLSYFIGGVSTIFIIFSSFYSYQKSILQNASDSDIGQTKKQKQKSKNKNKKTKKQKDYKNIALSTNIKYKDIAKISKANKAKNKDKKSNKKAKKKLDKKQDKLQKHFNQASMNLKMFLFLPKIIGYVILCYGYIYLSDNHLMNIYAFLIGISVLPLFSFVVKIIDNK